MSAGTPGRLAALGCEGPWRGALTDLLSATAEPKRLRPVTWHLALAITFTARGDLDRAHHHGEAALAAGASRAEAVEAAVVAALHSGWGALERLLWIAEAAAPGPWAGRGTPPEEDPSAVVAYFERAFDGLPPWIESLAEAWPDVLTSYHRLRFDALGDGALARSDKELILVVCNCAEHYELGMRLHMQGALTAGATREDLLDAIRCSMAAGGLVAWVEGATALAAIES